MASASFLFFSSNRRLFDLLYPHLYCFPLSETRQQIHCSTAEIEKVVGTMISQLHLLLDVRVGSMRLIKLEYTELYIYKYI